MSKPFEHFAGSVELDQTILSMMFNVKELKERLHWETHLEKIVSNFTGCPLIVSAIKDFDFQFKLYLTFFKFHFSFILLDSPIRRIQKACQCLLLLFRA